MTAPKLSEAQVRTLAALRQSGDWLGSDDIMHSGGSVASLPKLLDANLIEERPHPWRPYRRQWRCHK